MKQQRAVNSRMPFIYTFICIIAVIVWVILARGMTVTPMSNEVKNTQKNSESKTVVAIGDLSCSPEIRLRIGDCRTADVAESVKHLNPDTVLFLGDLQYNKGELKWFEQEFDRHWGQFRDIAYPVPGNHEYRTINALGYFSYWNKGGITKAGDPNKGYYSFSIGEWHVVALNSNCEFVSCDVGSEQIEWLKKDLAENRTKCTLAYWHHPRFTSGKYQGLSTNSERSKEFWNVLYDNSAEVILNGHDHMYERFAKQDTAGKAEPQRGIRQFIVGTGGHSLYKIQQPHTANHEHGEDKHYGYLELELKDTSYSWSFVSVDNKVLDTGRTGCHD